MRAQQGSALIAVLFILLLISLLGAMAVRQGLTSLNIATNSQVNALLFQSADSVFAKLEEAVNSQPTGNLSNPISFIADTSIDGKELMLCYRPLTEQSFSVSAANSSAVIPDATGNGTTTEGGKGSGYCDLTADFTSARRAVVTQVAAVVPQDGANDYRPFEFAPKGTDVSNTKIDETKRVRTYVTSILPGLADVDLSTVQSECIENRSNDSLDTINQSRETMYDCLARYGVPAKTQVQEYQLATVVQQRALN